MPSRDGKQLEFPRMDTMPKLELPRRWELLRDAAESKGIEITQFVERVDAAADHVDELLQKVRSGGGGLFEVFYGLSGSGKTTFLNTLPKFFDKIRVHSVGSDRDIFELPRVLRETYLSTDDASRVILIERRDNPKQEDLDKLDAMFGELLDAFRQREGRVLVLWPVTNEKNARLIAEKAWGAGRDSMVLRSTRGFYEFKGVPKERYFELADMTARNISGDGLASFGVTAETAATLLGTCDTIADFFSEVDDAALKLREKTWSVLKARVFARLWVLLPGDDIAALSNTVSALTQGNSNRIDIDRIAEMIDSESGSAIYLQFWKERRGSLAHLLRALDVRLFFVAPNVALAAIRSCGSAGHKDLLKQSSANLDQSIRALKASPFYRAILREIGVEVPPPRAPKSLKPETGEEYNRIQAVAAKNDDGLNRALGALLAECLRADAPNLQVQVEKRKLPGSQLQPDICIQLAPSDFICLEPTWRSTGKAVEGVREGGQSTLSQGFMLKYVLDKAADYVKDLGL